MGFSGLIAVSENKNVIPDLAFFSLLLKDQVLMEKGPVRDIRNSKLKLNDRSKIY